MTLRGLAVIAASLAFGSLAKAGDYPDCEKYDEPLAYNQCLASHGPSALHALAATPDEGAVREIHGFHGVPSAQPIRRAHGRMSASFDIEPSRKRRR
jgi:hypothetical protein